MARLERFVRSAESCETLTSRILTMRHAPRLATQAGGISHQSKSPTIAKGAAGPNLLTDDNLFSPVRKNSLFLYLFYEKPDTLPNGREIISHPFTILKARKMQEKYKYGLWGAAAGAIALAIVGFTWGGWVTGNTAKMQADAAGWTALLPVCADAILADPAAVAALKTKRTTDYDDVVRDHLKVIAGRADMSFTFRRDCGKVIEARMTHALAK